MARRAIDIVLLPSPAMTNKAISVNMELVRRYGDKIVLNRENCFPHISLCMGVLEEENIPAVSKILATIAGDFSPLHLTATGLPAHPDVKGDMISDFEIKLTRPLQKLHEAIMNKTAGYLTYEVAAGMLAPPPPYGEGTFQWIISYPEKSAFRNFRPHITAGFGGVEIKGLPFRFTASKLALCHLGNHCTCREVLSSVVLENT
jgi:2'-5' RNA ligase